MQILIRSYARKILLTSLLFAALAIPLLSHAQAQNCATGGTGNFVPLACVSGSKLGQLYSNTTDLTTYVNNIFTFALVIGGMAAVLRLTYAGYLYMGQSDMWSHKGQAKTIIGEVVLGLLLLLGVWLILYQINPDILSLRAIQDIPQLPPQPASNQTPSAQTLPTQQEINNAPSNMLINGANGSEPVGGSL